MSHTDKQRTIGALQVVGGIVDAVYGGGYGGTGGGLYLIGSGARNLAGSKSGTYNQGGRGFLTDLGASLGAQGASYGAGQLGGSGGGGGITSLLGGQGQGGGLGGMLGGGGQQQARPAQPPPPIQSPPTQLQSPLLTPNMTPATPALAAGQGRLTPQQQQQLAALLRGG